MRGVNVLALGNPLQRRLVASALRRVGLDVSSPRQARDVIATIMVGASRGIARERVFHLDEVETMLATSELNAIAHILSHILPLPLALRTTRRCNPSVRGDCDRLRVFIVDDDDMMRTTLVRAIHNAAKDIIDVAFLEAANLASAVAQVESSNFDILVVDVRLGAEGDRSGLVLLEYARTCGFEGSAFVLTGYDDYFVATRAADLGAEYVPKENLAGLDFANRVLGRTTPWTPRERTSGTHLTLSAEHVAEFLAEDPSGLQVAVSQARTLAVQQTVDALDGNRTAAARKLRMSRQQIQVILDSTVGKK